MIRRFLPNPTNPKPAAKERPAKADACHQYCKEVEIGKRNCHVYLLSCRRRGSNGGSASSCGVWGCEALVKRDTPDKLEQRSVKCIFIGYPKETMGYYFYFPPENKIVVARYAEFFEKRLISQEISGMCGGESKHKARNLELNAIAFWNSMTERDDTKSQEQDIFRILNGGVWNRRAQASTNCPKSLQTEYIAASEAAMEAVWIRKFISGLGRYQR
ncbi:hypothetical protein Tco_0450971 [Tanacetum coccineum]